MDNFITNDSPLELDLASENEAFAAVSLNPAVTWARFILTDDKPNLNRERVPEDEFDNLIRTGIYMPIKMAYKQIEDGHANAFPIGVISHLKKSNNQIVGLAALWERERPEDVNLIKQRYQNKEPLQLSWEILYSDSSTNEDGVKDLHGANLRAVTLVGMPAYGGRTPIIAVASENSDNTKEDTKLEELENTTSELEELKTSLSAKEAELAEKLAELERVNAELAAKNSELESATSALTKANDELESLRQFKAGVEEKEAVEQKFSSIKRKFSDCNLTKDEEYFTKNKEMLLKMPEDALDFMLQEEIAFSSKVEKPQATSSTKIPPVGSSKKEYTNVDLAKALRAKLQK